MEGEVKLVKVVEGGADGPTIKSFGETVSCLNGICTDAGSLMVVKCGDENEGDSKSEVSCATSSPKSAGMSNISVMSAMKLCVSLRSNLKSWLGMEIPECIVETCMFTES